MHRTKWQIQALKPATLMFEEGFGALAIPPALCRSKQCPHSVLCLAKALPIAAVLCVKALRCFSIREALWRKYSAYGWQWPPAVLASGWW